MSWFTSLLARVLPGLLVDATTRLVQAARESLRPKPPADLVPPAPIGDDGLGSYLAGANDEKHRQHERERLKRGADELARKAAEVEPVEAEQAVDDEGNRS